MLDKVDLKTPTSTLCRPLEETIKRPLAFKTEAAALTCPETRRHNCDVWNCAISTHSGILWSFQCQTLTQFLPGTSKCTLEHTLPALSPGSRILAVSFFSVAEVGHHGFLPSESESSQDPSRQLSSLCVHSGNVQMERSINTHVDTPSPSAI